DVFTELSLDNGTTWTPASGPIIVTLVPQSCAQIQCPADVTLECPATPDPAVTGTPTTLGSCSDVSLGHSDSLAGDSCTNIITRTWTATDAWGATTSCVQVITSVDTTPPALVVD